MKLLKVGAFAIATILCWRNAKENSIVSGQIVWQAIAVGLCFYGLGDIISLLWHLLWSASTTTSLGDVFYGMGYLFLAIGLFNAVLPRQTSLSIWQTMGIATAGILGIVLASWMSFYMPNVEVVNPISSNNYETEGMEIIASQPDQASQKTAPQLVQIIDTRLKPIARHMRLLYVAGDCILIVIASAMLVAFWGGTYSEAWKLIALAGLCLYVADMFMIYHQRQGSYQPGAFWEIFWILSALFFGLGASIEYGISTQMQQRRSRQQRT
ncbi:MAG: hypothetical protein AAF703_02990 [Cyanobacteria bacterium P01_D01_bin.105]